MGVKSFGLSCEDAQDNYDWKLKIKGVGLYGKRPLKWYVCVFTHIEDMNI